MLQTEWGSCIIYQRRKVDLKVIKYVWVQSNFFISLFMWGFIMVFVAHFHFLLSFDITIYVFDFFMGFFIKLRYTVSLLIGNNFIRLSTKNLKDIIILQRSIESEGFLNFIFLLILYFIKWVMLFNKSNIPWQNHHFALKIIYLITFLSLWVANEDARSPLYFKLISFCFGVSGIG